MDAELRFHFDARVADLTTGGISPDAARRRALDEFGDVASISRGLREIDSRVAARRGRAEVVGGWWQDLCYAARSIRRAPGLTIGVVLTLALGLGANAALFSLLDVLFLRPPAGVVAPNQVRRIWVQDFDVRSGLPVYTSRILYFAQYTALQQALGSEAQVALYHPGAGHHMGPGHAGVPVNLTYATASLFRTLGVRPQLGRFFTPDEDRLDQGSPVAVISDAFWHRQYHADPRVLGTTINVDNDKFVVVGVAQPDFTGVELQPQDVWVPFGVFSFNTGGSQPWWENINVNGMSAVVRLAPAKSNDGIHQC